MLRFLALLPLLIPSLSNAQGSSFKTDFRMIDFDAPRDVCVAAETPIFVDHESEAFGVLQDQSDKKALGISLDQDWIAIEVGEAVYLVRPDQVRFENC